MSYIFLPWFNEFILYIYLCGYLFAVSLILCAFPSGRVMDGLLTIYWLCCWVNEYIRAGLKKTGDTSHPTLKLLSIWVPSETQEERRIRHSTVRGGIIGPTVGLMMIHWKSIQRVCSFSTVVALSDQVFKNSSFPSASHNEVLNCWKGNSDRNIVIYCTVMAETAARLDSGISSHEQQM